MGAPNPSSPVGIVIATHGDLAHALQRNAEMIVGPQDGVVPLGLDPPDTPESLKAALLEAIDRVDRGSGVLVLVDLFGGTPSQVAARCSARRPVAIAAGVNLPMLLDTLINRTRLTAPELAALAVESGAAGVVDVSARLS